MKMSLRVKKYLRVTSFLSSRMTGLALCSQGEADVDAEAFLGAGAFVPGLHDARAGAGDDHEPGRRDLAAELDPLLILLPRRLRPGGAEHGYLAHMGVGREELEGETQLPERGLDHPHVATVLDVLQQLEPVGLQQ